MTATPVTPDTDTTPSTLPPLLIDTETTLRLMGGLSRAGYHKARNTGRFAPKAIKIGKKVLHRYKEVEDWINAGCPPVTRWVWSAD